VIILNLYKVRDEFDVPNYGTSLANCFDLSFQPSESTVKGYDKHNNPIAQYVNAQGEISIYPGDRLLIPTGLIFKVEQLVTIESYSDIVSENKPLQNYSIRLHARSGLSLKRGLILANSQGIVDVDYQEEVFVLLTNISGIGQTIKRGDRIAQAEVTTNEPIKFVVVTKHPEKHSERSGGFGSTGVSYDPPPMEEWKIAPI
jgi:dUTPase